MKQPKAQIMGSLQLKAVTFPDVSEVLKAVGTPILTDRLLEVNQSTVCSHRTESLPECRVLIIM